MLVEFQCSDFTCCGLSLIDLHSLVDHFEEAHVVVFDSAGNAVYPHPSPLLRVVDHENKGPYMSFVLGYPMPAAPVAFIASEDVEGEGKSDADSEPTSEPTSPVDTSSEEEPRHLPPIVSVNAAIKPMLPVRNGKREQRSQSRSRQWRKDKTYKCPHPDCTKTYLNANGLKYHLEKGTCKTEISVPKFYR